jgi:enoyl-CoA hydratase/carnithine racemase
MPDYEYVLSTSDGPVGIVTLNRPKQLNALAGPLMAELVDALERHDADGAVRAIVVTGGTTVFAAGADIKEMADSSAIDMLLRNSIGLWDRVHQVSKPLIAAVAGYALGGGCELALACDWRVVADDAKLGQPEIKLGIIPGAGGTQRLARLIGPARAKDLIFSGRMVEAEEALRIGLADRVAPAADVYETAVRLVRPYVTGPSLALRAAKQAIDGGLSVDLASGLALESQLFAGLFATDDRVEGTTAFVEKRKPTFTGR